AVNPQQQMIAKVMPFIFVPISVSLPAGVVIYFVVSNLVRIGQQALVTRLDFRGAAGGDGAGAKPSKSPSAPPKDEVAKGNGKAAKSTGNAKQGGSAKRGAAQRANAKRGGTNAKRGNGTGPRGKGGDGKQANAKSVNGRRPDGQNAKPSAPVAPRPRKRKKKRR
ncbi:MAG: YidC/Oxa1 family membrane protein insertase, partial [Actinomycetota bacterium]|nr:YidC/Oxa1 family membrane protein insertase [Actinomycetota bacterium]